MVLWLPVIVLALQARSTYEPNEQRTAESAFQFVNAALRKLAPVWKIVHNIEGRIPHSSDAFPAPYASLY
jgi:hypothetical protein